MSAKAKIFLIDDDKFVLKSTEKLFRSYDLEICCFLDPVEGLNQIVEQKPQIVFLDYTMPDLTGEELIIKVSEAKVFNLVACYLLSGNEFDKNDVIKLRTLGFYNVITKPLKGSQIRAILEEHLGEIPYKVA